MWSAELLCRNGEHKVTHENPDSEFQANDSWNEDFRKYQENSNIASQEELFVVIDSETSTERIAIFWTFAPTFSEWGENSG